MRNTTVYTAAFLYSEMWVSTFHGKEAVDTHEHFVNAGVATILP